MRRAAGVCGALVSAAIGFLNLRRIERRVVEEE
jgi:hypothetical protein